MKTRLPLFFKWGIRFEEVYEVPEQAAREVVYADRLELEEEIVRRSDFDEEDLWRGSVESSLRISSDTSPKLKYNSPPL